MIKNILTILIVLLIVSSSFALDKKIEKALAANDWQQVYELLEKKEKYKKNPLQQFLMYQACFALDCDLSVSYPRFDMKSLKKLTTWIEKFSKKYQYNIVAKHLYSELHSIKGNYNKSVQYSIEISKGDSTFLLAYMTRSKVFFMQRKFEYALNALNLLLAQDSTHAWGYLNRGAVYDEMHDYQKALLDYEKSVELNPNNATAYYNQGNTYRHLNNESLAIVSFSKVIELDSKNFAAYHNRGNAYFDTQDYENSIQDYEKFLKLAPKEMHNQKLIIKQKIEFIKNGRK